MKNTLIRSLSLIGISLLMTLSVAAQEDPKLKVNDKEGKFKSEDLKLKAEKEKEAKYKSDELKGKDKKGEVKVKGITRPMRATSTINTEMRTGETQVRTKEQIEPINTNEVVVEPAAPSQIAVSKPAVRKYTHKKTVHKYVATRKTNTRPKYIVRTKVVRDTVFVPSAPEKIVSTQTKYIHDTVSVTRVDTVVKMETKNTYTGYSVPRGNFKKVTLKKDKKTGEVYMKRKEGK